MPQNYEFLYPSSLSVTFADGFACDSERYCISNCNIHVNVYKLEKVPETRAKKQTIYIHWNFIGAVAIPVDKEKTA